MKAIETKSAIIFIRRFLFHALVAWLVFNSGDLIFNFSREFFGLAHTTNPDGTSVSIAQRFINHNLNQPLILWILLLALLAEANYLFVFRKYNLFWFAFSSILLAKLGSGASFLFQKNSDFIPPLARFIDSTFFVLVYIFGYAILYDFFYDRYRRIRFHQQKSEAELHLLKAQINPHFFFNTLNNIYGIALSEQATKTAGAIELLSDMMRYNMTGVKEDFVSLTTELKFIEDYLALQQLRIPANDDIMIRTEIVYPETDYSIAPMLLIPLIENAWKYGISMDRPCFIDLTIAVVDQQLTMNIENQVFDTVNPEKGSGMGIVNVKQRLELIYPEKHKLSITSVGSKYRVALSISL
ncbi:MAG TPA: sensor histidine kinase [Mucilaginibacter sp.]|nr:sensor histidine kinase [Mucilaginibacter sp.]